MTGRHAAEAVQPKAAPRVIGRARASVYPLKAALTPLQHWSEELALPAVQVTSTMRENQLYAPGWPLHFYRLEPLLRSGLDTYIGLPTLVFTLFGRPSRARLRVISFLKLICSKIKYCLGHSEIM